MRDALRQLSPPRRAVLYGVVAWVTGMGIMLVILALGGDSSRGLLDFPLVSATYFWSLLHGWAGLFSGQIALIILATIPATLLIGMGYYSAQRSAERPESGARRGAWIAAGYLPVATLCFAWLFFRLNSLVQDVVAGTPGALDPLSLLLPLVFTGFVFPVAFGGLGGYLADRRSAA